MATWSDGAQRELGRQSGEALDRQTASSPYLRRPTRSLEEVLADQIAEKCEELDAACDRLKATLRKAQEALREYRAALGDGEGA